MPVAAGRLVFVTIDIIFVNVDNIVFWIFSFQPSLSKLYKNFKKIVVSMETDFITVIFRSTFLHFIDWKFGNLIF